MAKAPTPAAKKPSTTKPASPKKSAAKKAAPKSTSKASRAQHREVEIVGAGDERSEGVLIDDAFDLPADALDELRGVSTIDPAEANEEAYRSAKDVDPSLLTDDFVAPTLVVSSAKKPGVKASALKKSANKKSLNLPRVVDAEVVDGPHKKSSGSSTEVSTSQDPITTYLAEIRKYPLLTKELEQQLAQAYRETGDKKAAEMLVTSNLRFVVKVAAEYSRFGAKLIDLVQEGNVGLMHAVREFNPYKGVRLITYAVWWIRGYIQEYLMRQYSLVRIGTTQNQRKLFYRLQKEQNRLDSQGHAPNVAMIAGRLGVSEEEVETMAKRMSGRDVSLSAPVDSENPGASLLDFEAAPELLADESIGNFEELSVLRDNLEALRPTLGPKEIYILENRILSDEPMTLQEIGAHYGTTREAVRQLEARLIGKIRKAVTEALHED